MSREAYQPPRDDNQELSRLIDEVLDNPSWAGRGYDLVTPEDFFGLFTKVEPGTEGQHLDLY